MFPIQIENKSQIMYKNMRAKMIFTMKILASASIHFIHEYSTINNKTYFMSLNIDVCNAFFSYLAQHFSNYERNLSEFPTAQNQANKTNSLES